MAIAAAAVVDPVWSTDRDRPPVVALAVADGAADAVPVVTRALDGHVRVGTWPLSGATAVVGVGRLPPGSPTAVPGVVVDIDTADVTIEQLNVPARALLSERVPVDVTLGTRREGGLIGLALELVVEGRVVERRAIDAAGLEGARRLSLTPPGVGTYVVQVRAIRESGRVVASAGALVTVAEGRWRVLVHDARPSWPSTFVRRALESDARFDVTARVATSRQATAVSGGSGSLADLSATDVVIVGVPADVSGAEDAALEAFMRQRGGSVVYLFDQVPSAGVAGVAAWTERLAEEPRTANAVGRESSLLFGELAEARGLPTAAEVLAAVDGADATPVVWQRPVGQGLLIVNGALDAWRHRDRGDAGFDAFWRAVVAEAAARVPPAVSVSFDRRVARPGSRVRATVTMLEASDEEVVSATLLGGDSPRPVRLWPIAPGRFEAMVEMPPRPGRHRLIVTTAGHTGQADVATDDGDLVLATAASVRDRAVALGWPVMPLSRIAEPGTGLVAALESLSPPAVAPASVRPMRSVWWIVPFALALGLDWWQRRRTRRLDTRSDAS